MKAMILELRPKDRVHQDAAPIALIYKSMGTKAAEEVVSRALGELAFAMTSLATLVRGSDLADVARQLRRLQRMAEQLGLVSLGKVAGDAQNCLRNNDLVAFPAVWARLVRVAECSLATETGSVDQQR
ncbi:MAG: hypothetical protein L0H65_16305 [Pseudorhodobacter sp.]|nr:hypothetical protein [Pseudorhodobacter sp.]